MEPAGTRVGYVYVTDQPLATTGYLWDRLPSYRDEEVAAVGSAAPELRSVVLVASGLAALAGAMSLKRKRRR